MNNRGLNRAKAARNDEFYTLLPDIEKELCYYSKHFKGKTVYCNCDNPEWSNFWRYFYMRFEELGLKKLISSHYSETEPSYSLEYVGAGEPRKSYLRGNGDFRSPECVGLLRQADIVVTNPGFSLFRDFITLLLEHGKQFLVIGSINAIGYKCIFPLIRDNKLWLGCNSGPKTYRVPQNSEDKSAFIGADGLKYCKLGNTVWYTNIDTEKHHQPLSLSHRYSDNPSLYPRYDNYLAWNVNKTSDIPVDSFFEIEIDKDEIDRYLAIYEDLEIVESKDRLKIRVYRPMLGVPISYLNDHCPDQFDIVGLAHLAEMMPEPVVLGEEFINRYRAGGGTGHFSAGMYGVYYTDGDGKVKVPYGRILIRAHEDT